MEINYNKFIKKLNISIIRNGVLMIVDYIRKKTTYIRHFPHFNQK